jgi:outer membrane protein OmpA-like peptidoglycan-associated protein
MVLNQRQPEAEPIADTPETEPSFVSQVSDPIDTREARPAFTNELITSIPFLTNKYEMGPAAQLEAERVAEVLVYHPESTAELTGYTDITGDEDFNMILSQYRAEKIAEYLEMRGIDRERIKVDDKGASDPLALNRFSDGSDATLGRYLNRTVKVKIMGTLPILISSFQDMKVTEYTCKDGYYRYTTSSFRTFKAARQRLLILRKRGYPDAFIQTREWYDKASQ